MDALYSFSLFVACSAAAGGLALALLALPVARRLFAGRSWPGSGLRARLAAAAPPCLAAGAGSLALSVAVHWRWGHGQESLEPMGLGAFLDAHRAFVVVLLVLIAGAALETAGRRRRSG